MLSKFGEVALVIVVAHHGSKLTFHSLHDGSLLHEKALSLDGPGAENANGPAVTDMWWTKHQTKPRPAAFKDVFDRKEVVRDSFIIHLAINLNFESILACNCAFATQTSPFC